MPTRPPPASPWRRRRRRRRRRLTACSSSSGARRRAGGPTAAAPATGDPRVTARDRHGGQGLHAGPAHVPGRRLTFKVTQQGRHRGQRGRAAQRRAHPRREGEPAARLHRHFAVDVPPARTRCTARARRPSAARSRSPARPAATGATASVAALLKRRPPATRTTSTPRSARSRRDRASSTPRCTAPTCAAQDAYMKARPFYEQIEPVAESFTVGKRQPRRRHRRRARATSPPAVERLPPHREGAVPAEVADRAGHATATSWWPTSSSCRR